MIAATRSVRGISELALGVRQLWRRFGSRYIFGSPGQSDPKRRRATRGSLDGVLAVAALHSDTHWLLLVLRDYHAQMLGHRRIQAP